MTDYKATPEQWAGVEATHAMNERDFNRRNYDSAILVACILELRSRLETLESANTARCIETIRLTNAVANQVPNRAKLFADVTPDNDDNDPDNSLVEQVRAAINHSFDYDARAAIRAVASWLRSELVSRNIAERLEQEADR
jgi:hypothetical protein